MHRHEPTLLWAACIWDGLMTEVKGEYLTGTVSEASFQRTVIEMARYLGWRVHHGRPGRTTAGWRTPVSGDVGFPDLVLLRGGRLIFAELKTERGRLSVGQKAWLLALGGVEWVEVQLWRPSDMGRIELALR